MPTLTVAQGATHYPLDATLQDAHGAPIDLTNATAVHFRMTDTSTGDRVLNRRVTVDDADAGRVSYQWRPGDLATPGKFRGTFYVRFTDRTELWVPSRSRDLTITVRRAE